MQLQVLQRKFGLEAHKGYTRERKIELIKKLIWYGGDSRWKLLQEKQEWEAPATVSHMPPQHHCLLNYPGTFVGLIGSVIRYL